MVFLLTKGERYFYDAEAIREAGPTIMSEIRDTERQRMDATGERKYPRPANKFLNSHDVDAQRPQRQKRLDHRQPALQRRAFRHDAARSRRALHQGWMPCWRARCSTLFLELGQPL